ncbi:Ig-like domain-containing protein, partial [Rhodococcus sp. IEGM 1241]|uniref:Ig-like domain-containing protein n=1 Tax=Rhodococcus sp. IEGM 1241 TaxID=3082228 RepID=UPI002952BC38
MSRNLIRRGIALVGVASVALLTVGSISATVSSAATATVSEGKYRFTRSSNVDTVYLGDKITYTTALTKSGIDGYINTFVDVHPACLTYETGSAKLTRGSTSSITPSSVTGTSVTVTNAGWLVNGNNPWTFSVTYLVTDSCAFGALGGGVTARGTVMGSSGFGVSEDHSTMGPSVTVAKRDTTTTLSVPATATVGSSVDLTATVGPNNVPGAVQFKDNSSNIGSPVTVSGGVATLAHSFGSVGSRSVTAVFTPSAVAYASSTSAAANVAVSNPIPVDVQTTTSLSVPATAIAGTAVDLTATVAPSNAVGSVQFKSNGAAIGSPVTVSAGVATLSHVFDIAGAQSVTADFIAGAGFVSSSASAQTVTVSDPAPVDVETTTSLSVPPTAVTGAAVDLSATVAPNNAVGTVQFKSNGAAIGSPVTVSAGVATLSHAFDVAGAQSVTADFIAGAGFVSSSAPAQTVTVSDPAPVDVETTTSLSVPPTAVTGAAVDLSATVAP